MSDLERYVKKRKRTDPRFAEGFEVGYFRRVLGLYFCQPVSLNAVIRHSPKRQRSAGVRLGRRRRDE